MQSAMSGLFPLKINMWNEMEPIRENAVQTRVGGTVPKGNASAEFKSVVPKYDRYLQETRENRSSIKANVLILNG